MAIDGIKNLFFAGANQVQGAKGVEGGAKQPVEALKPTGKEAGSEISKDKEAYQKGLGGTGEPQASAVVPGKGQGEAGKKLSLVA